MNVDERPIIACRIEVPPSMAEGVDAWMPKHFDDSLDHEAVTSVAAYRVLQDFDPTNGLPWLLNGHGNRFIVYVAEDMDSLRAWVDSPFLREAIDDGVDRETSYPELDGESFTGNTYECSGVRMPLGVDFAGPNPILIERFQVAADTDEEFTKWLEGSYADAWAALASTLRVRTYRQAEDLPKDFPFDRYQSKGNRMLLVELAPETDLRAFVGQADVRRLLMESLRWDLELSYVRREVAECYVIRDKNDAASTLAERRAESVGV